MAGWMDVAFSNFNVYSYEISMMFGELFNISYMLDTKKTSKCQILKINKSIKRN